LVKRNISKINLSCLVTCQRKKLYFIFVPGCNRLILCTIWAAWHKLTYDTIWYHWYVLNWYLIMRSLRYTTGSIYLGWRRLWNSKHSIWLCRFPDDVKYNHIFSICLFVVFQVKICTRMNMSPSSWWVFIINFMSQCIFNFIFDYLAMLSVNLIYLLIIVDSHST